MRRPFLACALASLVWTMLQAQTAGSAAIRGQALDSTGVAILQAEVHLTNTATGLQRSTRTDSAGYYEFANLPLTGAYRIEVTGSRLARKDIDNIRLRSGETASLNFTLAPESGHSEVTVFGTVDGVRTDSPQAGT